MLRDWELLSIAGLEILQRRAFHEDSIDSGGRDDVTVSAWARPPPGPKTPKLVRHTTLGHHASSRCTLVDSAIKIHSNHLGTIWQNRCAVVNGL